MASSTPISHCICGIDFYFSSMVIFFILPLDTCRLVCLVFAAFNSCITYILWDLGVCFKFLPDTCLLSPSLVKHQLELALFRNQKALQGAILIKFSKID